MQEFTNHILLPLQEFEKSLDEGVGDTLRSGKGLSGREHILKLVLKQHEDKYTDLRTFTYVYRMVANGCELT